MNLDTLSSASSEEEIGDSGRSFQSLIVWAYTNLWSGVMEWSGAVEWSGFFGVLFLGSECMSLKVR